MISLSYGIIKRVISKYSGYKEDKRKEDDLAVKKHILNEIEKARTHLKNSQEILYRKSNQSGALAVRSVLDELDLFSNEIDLSESGHRYKFFSKHSGTSLEQLEKLIEHDKELIERMRNVTEACERFEKELLEGRELNIDAETGKLRHYVTITRNKFKDRLEHIKSIGS